MFSVPGSYRYDFRDSYYEVRTYKSPEGKEASWARNTNKRNTAFTFEVGSLAQDEEVITATIKGTSFAISAQNNSAIFNLQQSINPDSLTWVPVWWPPYYGFERKGDIWFTQTTPNLILTIGKKKLDNTRPVTNAVISPEPVNGLNDDDVTVTLTATDPEPNPSGVKELHYNINNTGDNTVLGGSAAISINSPGTFVITYYAIDNAGNTESPNTKTINIRYYDTVIIVLVDQPPINNPNPVCEPLFSHNGEINSTTTDLTIPGQGIPFSFIRTYRSQIMFKGPLGYGWDFNYNERLLENTVDNKVLYFNGSSRRDEFTIQPDGSYTAPTGFYVALEKLPDNSFKLLERDGTVKLFNQAALTANLFQLASITDRNGNRITCGYNAQDQLTQITDTLNRSIIVRWGNKSRISEIEDFMGRKVIYTIDDNSDLTSVTTPSSAEYPNGNTANYTYSSGFADAGLNHNLLTLADHKSQTYVVNNYGANDRVEAQEYGTDSFQISYITNTDNTLVTTIIDRKGNKKVYYHNSLGNAIREDVYTQAQGIITTQWEYNTQGERTRTILPKGNSIEYVYDANNPILLSQGNLLQVKRVSLTPDSLPLTTGFTYEPRHNQIKSITDALGRVTTFYFDYEELSQGDLNGDGITNQDKGNIVKIAYPVVTKGLAAATNPQIIEAKFWYNANGQLTRSISPEGYVSINEYYTSGSMKGYLYRISREVGGGKPAITSVFEYDLVGNITNIYDGKGNKTSFTVNALNQVTQTTSRLGYCVKFSYDANGNIEQMQVENKDQNNNSDPDLPWITTTYGYDILDNLISKTEQVSSAKSIITRYGYDQNGNRDLITQPEGNQVKNYYDERDLLSETIRGYGTSKWTSVKRFYDLNGNLERVQDGKGHNITYLIDGFDRVYGYVDALGNRMEQGLDDVGNVTRVIRRGVDGVILSEAKYLYDELNRNYEIQEWLDTTGGWVTTRNEFDKNSRVVRVVDANNHQTLMAYDGLGRVKSGTDHLGNKVEYNYDENSNVTEAKETELSQVPNPASQVYTTSNEYDALDRLIKNINPIGVIRGYSFDSRNNLVYSMDGEGNTASNAYDGMNRLIQAIRDLRQGGKGSGSITKQVKTKYQWDDNSRLLALEDDNGNITSYMYDVLNRREEETLPDGTIKKFTYDAADNIEQIIDANGTQIAQTFDDINRLTRKDIIKGTNVIGGSYEEFGYDGLSRMTSAKNDYSSVAMQYDSLNRLLEEQQQIGNLSAKLVKSAYDQVGNRTGLTYPSGKAINFVPDELNRIKQIASGQQTIVAYNYSGPFRIQDRTYGNGSKLNVAYDANRRVTEYNHSSIKAWMPRDKKDQGKGKGKGQEKEYAGVELRQIIIGFGYGYDGEDNRLYEKRLHEGGKGDAYTYDSLYRLIVVQYDMTNPTQPPASNNSPLTTQSWNLDGVGNWNNLIADNQTTTYAINNLNQYMQIDNQSLTYDHNGNLTSKREPLMKHLKERFGFCKFPKAQDWEDERCDSDDEDDDECNKADDLKDELDNCGINEHKSRQAEMEYQYAYDYANRLIKASKSFIVEGKVVFTREVVSYTYDALGRRIAKSKNQSITNYYYYDGVRVIEEYNADNELKQSYIYGNGIDEVLMMQKGRKQYYYHENALGSITHISNNKGEVVESYKYTAYGKATIYDGKGKERKKSRVKNNILFTGREYDMETGLYYYRARYYSAEMGRFLQRDPIGYSDGMNLYEYVRSNPANFIDPLGLEAKGNGMGGLNDWQMKELSKPDTLARGEHPWTGIPPPPKLRGWSDLGEHFIEVNGPKPTEVQQTPLAVKLFVYELAYLYYNGDQFISDYFNVLRTPLGKMGTDISNVAKMGQDPFKSFEKKGRKATTETAISVLIDSVNGELFDYRDLSPLEVGLLFGKATKELKKLDHMIKSNDPEDKQALIKTLVSFANFKIDNVSFGLGIITNDDPKRPDDFIPIVQIGIKF
ncbi:MAG: RHS repeat-associated core domain-containing protein [Candidatus Brocadiia bacterium]